MRFSELGLPEALVKNVTAAGYETATPIQQQAIGPVLQGRDVVALAQTGTGKTAAFSLPMLARLSAERPPRRAVRSLILSPTRELAAQIGDSITTYGKGLGFTHTVIFGGVGQVPQEKTLQRGVDIIVATPGRLLALMHEGHVKFSGLEFFVLDEADRMLDMGFIHDVKKIIAALPAARQTLLFSATMPDDIEDLARRFMREPLRVAVNPPSSTVDKINQSIFMVENGNKRSLLLHLLKDTSVERALLFTRTKHGANRVAEVLDKAGVAAAAIHGNKSQSARERALSGFKSGAVRVLVATDIAARGIDVDGVSHVIQVDLPEVPEQYVHRIGRTARAGRDGIAWAFCSSDDRPLLRDIERNIRKKIEVVDNHPFVGPANEQAMTARTDERGPPRGHGRPTQGRGPAPRGYGDNNQGRSRPGGGGGGGGRGRPSPGGQRSSPRSSGPR